MQKGALRGWILTAALPLVLGTSCQLVSPDEESEAPEAPETENVAAAGPPFVEFESGQVRPLAISPDGATLFAVNTPDNRSRSSTSPTAGWSSAPACRSASSRSRSRRAPTTRSGWSTTCPTASASSSLQGVPRVVRTLLVGDEPRDIVFAGTRRPRLHHHRAPRPAPPTRRSVRPGAGDPQLTTPGVGARRRLGVRPGPARRDARRHAAADRELLHRHAARARGQPRRQHRLRGRLPVRQPDHRHRREDGVRRRPAEHAVHQRQRLDLAGRHPGPGDQLRGRAGAGGRR